MQTYTIFVKQTAIILIFSIHQDNSYFICVFCYIIYDLWQKDYLINQI